MVAGSAGPHGKLIMRCGPLTHASVCAGRMGQCRCAGWYECCCVDCEVVPGGEVCRARVLGESGFGDGEAIGRRWWQRTRRSGEGVVSVASGAATSKKTAMTCFFSKNKVTHPIVCSAVLVRPLQRAGLGGVSLDGQAEWTPCVHRQPCLARRQPSQWASALLLLAQCTCSCMRSGGRSRSSPSSCRTSPSRRIRCSRS